MISAKRFHVPAIIPLDIILSRMPTVCLIYVSLNDFFEELSVGPYTHGIPAAHQCILALRHIAKTMYALFLNH